MRTNLLKMVWFASVKRQTEIMIGGWMTNIGLTLMQSVRKLIFRL